MYFITYQELNTKKEVLENTAHTNVNITYKYVRRYVKISNTSKNYRPKCKNQKGSKAGIPNLRLAGHRRAIVVGPPSVTLFLTILGFYRY